LDPAFEIEGDRVTLTPYQGVPSLHIAFGKAQIEKVGGWYYNFERDAEFERGFYDNEDLPSPRFEIRAWSRGFALNHCFVGGTPAGGKRRSGGREIQRRAELIRSSRHSESFITSLTTAADQFIVRRGELDTIIAGYHWFGDWGRDTVVALPGLTLATGRAEIARGILETFAHHVDQVMLPNRFPDDGADAEYNTVDAALWMFEAAQAYLNQTDDWSFVENNL
jgi:predicted glycogen debranching enzyme